MWAELKTHNNKLYALIDILGSGSDYRLVEVNPTNSTYSIISITGIVNIYSLATSGNNLYGYSANDGIYDITNPALPIKIISTSVVSRFIIVG